MDHRQVHKAMSGKAEPRQWTLVTIAGKTSYLAGALTGIGAASDERTIRAGP